jgi:hypothetical protein
MAEQAGLPEATGLEERLERGEVVFFPTCPFPLPEAGDRAFLFQQRQNRIHKNISFNPQSGRLSGFCFQANEHTDRLRDLLRNFGERTTEWLGRLLPRYAAGWRRDRISLRPEEEAIRPLRLTARNDLLHFDAFPNRPTHGARILRLFVNINLSEARVWVTSDTFARLFARYGRLAGLPGGGGSWSGRLRDRLLRLFDPGRMGRGEYDSFMVRFHNFLKADDAFQEGCRKHFWKFPPNSLWLAFTDGVSHGELRGRYALEHSFFVPREYLVAPDVAPAAVLERACQSGDSPAGSSRAA